MRDSDFDENTRSIFVPGTVTWDLQDLAYGVRFCQRIQISFDPSTHHGDWLNNLCIYRDLVVNAPTIPLPLDAKSEGLL
jgi:hypothetical protein